MLWNVPYSDRGLASADVFLSHVYMADLFGRWRRFDSLSSAQRYGRNLRKQRVFRVLHSASHYQFTRARRVLARWFLRQKVREFERCRAVLCDVSVMTKGRLRESFSRGLMAVTAEAEWFSLPHGIDPMLPRTESSGAPPNIDVLRQRLTRVYSSSQKDSEILRKGLSLGEHQIAVTGIPRHDPWHAPQKSRYITEVEQPFIFVASRPSDMGFFHSSKKVKAVTAVNRMATELGYNILIRQHPIETDQTLFREILGSHLEGATWSFTGESPATVGARAEFAVVFHSSTIVDLVAASVPCVELFDTRGLKPGTQLVEIGAKQPVSKYVYYGLALPAHSHPTLRDQAGRIMRNREMVIKSQWDNYLKVFSSPIGAVERIEADIRAATDRPPGPNKR